MVMRGSFLYSILCVLVLSLSASAFADDFLREGVPPAVDALGADDKVAMPKFDVLAEILSPTVVNITVEGEKDKSLDALDGTPFQFFKKDMPVKALGSGLIVSEDGYIVTNHHVIDGASSIIVRVLNDKTEYKAKVVGIDEKTDLALIKINSRKKLEPAYLGNSDEIRVGEWVLAIGNQFQLGQTLTAGIVSAKSRRMPKKIIGPYDDFIQTDASINPGSSGGPLFNGHGQVVGINTAIFSPGRGQFGGTGFNIGIGFAIPINIVRGVINQLRSSGKVTRGMLGVIIQNVNADIAEALNVQQAGALVSEVLPDTPAARAGIQVKDILLSYGGHPIEEHDSLPLLVASTTVGTEVEVKLIRDGQIMTVMATITEMSDPEKNNKKNDVEVPSNVLGIQVQSLTEDVANLFEIKSSGGVVITEVEKDSIAENSGLMRGDVIEELAGEKIKNAEVFKRVVKSLDLSKAVLVLVRKRDGTRFLTVKNK